MRLMRRRLGIGAGVRARRRRVPDDRGQALVEFVLALPILLVIVFGIIEFATAWRTYQIVTNVAREGARLGVTPNTNTQEIIDRVDSLLVAANLTLANRSMTMTCTDPSGVQPTLNGHCGGLRVGNRFEVFLQYQHSFVVLGPVLNLMCAGCGTGYGTISLDSRAIMRTE
ncbi:MAG: TadE/TadG family type IV pilus assembly protein [Gemmatimonadota bacterium]|nr:TadE/TadG family type IV pilus assembly protein [Gemmatimonadota bacterium]